MDTEALTALLLGDEELSKEVISNLAGRLKPAIYAIGDEIQTVLRDYVNNDELFELRAQLKWKIYSAYVNAGFSEEQAMKFVEMESPSGQALSHLLPAVSEALQNGMTEFDPDGPEWTTD